MYALCKHALFQVTERLYQIHVFYCAHLVEITGLVVMALNQTYEGSDAKQLKHIVCMVKNGLPHGIFVEMDRYSNFIICVAYFNNGILQGPKKTFDFLGRLKTEELYTNGEKRSSWMQTEGFNRTSRRTMAPGILQDAYSIKQISRKIVHDPDFAAAKTFITDPVSVVKQLYKNIGIDKNVTMENSMFKCNECRLKLPLTYLKNWYMDPAVKDNSCLARLARWAKHKIHEDSESEVTLSFDVWPATTSYYP